MLESSGIAPSNLKHERVEGCCDDFMPTVLTSKIDHRTKEFFFFPIPQHLQHDPAKPFKFSYVIVVVYALIAMISKFTMTLCAPPFQCLFPPIVVMNLYYCQPLLSKSSLSVLVDVSDFLFFFAVEMAKSFNVSYESVSRYGMNKCVTSI